LNHRAARRRLRLAFVPTSASAVRRPLGIARRRSSVSDRAAGAAHRPCARRRCYPHALPYYEPPRPTGASAGMAQRLHDPRQRRGLARCSLHGIGWQRGGRGTSPRPPSAISSSSSACATRANADWPFPVRGALQVRHYLGPESFSAAAAGFTNTGGDARQPVGLGLSYPYYSSRGRAAAAPSEAARRAWDTEATRLADAARSRSRASMPPSSILDYTTASKGWRGRRAIRDERFLPSCRSCPCCPTVVVYTPKERDYFLPSSRVRPPQQCDPTWPEGPRHTASSRFASRRRPLESGRMRRGPRQSPSF
jgi:hypothetical protein